LRRASTASDPDAFERAVCGAFAALGFVATHIGGNAAPDGYLGAPLCTLGYRVMLECKTARGVVMEPDAVEASKYREAYHAQYAALIGPAFGEQLALASELRTHDVATLTVDDIATLLTSAINPAEMRALFEPGIAADRFSDLLWNRDHGEARRVAVACERLVSAAWSEQVTAAKTSDPQDAPILTEDAAMMLVDQALLEEGGSQQPLTRDQIRAAFLHLTDPIVGKAIRTDATRSAIVVTRLA
jgi:hypothetical protein